MDCGWYLNNKACFGGYQVSFPMSRHRLTCLVSVNAAVSMSADMLIRSLILWLPPFPQKAASFPYLSLSFSSLPCPSCSTLPLSCPSDYLLVTPRMTPSLPCPAPPCPALPCPSHPVLPCQAVVLHQLVHLLDCMHADCSVSLHIALCNIHNSGISNRHSLDTVHHESRSIGRTSVSRLSPKRLSIPKKQQKNLAKTLYSCWIPQGCL